MFQFYYGFCVLLLFIVGMVGCASDRGIKPQGPQTLLECINESQEQMSPEKKRMIEEDCQNRFPR